MVDRQIIRCSWRNTTPRSVSISLNLERFSDRDEHGDDDRWLNRSEIERNRRSYRSPIQLDHRVGRILAAEIPYTFRYLKCNNNFPLRLYTNEMEYIYIYYNEMEIFFLFSSLEKIRLKLMQSGGKNLPILVFPSRRLIRRPRAPTTG